MPRRRRFSYADYLNRLLSTSAPTKRQAPPRAVIRGDRQFDPTLYRQLVTAEKRAEAATDQAILQHEFATAENEQKHQHKLQEAVFTEEQSFRRALIERELDAEETAADIQDTRASTKLKEAQAQEIISKPAAKEWQAMIDKLAAGRKENIAVDLEVLDHRQNVQLEQVKQQNKIQLEKLKQALKPPKKPKESTLEEFQRLKNTGAISTVGDVAKYWHGKGKKREDIDILAKMEMREAGIPYEEVFKQEGGLWEDAESKKRAWQKLFTAPLKAAPPDQAVTNILKQYPSRHAAEQALYSRVGKLRGASKDAENDEAITVSEDSWLQIISQAYPQEPSVYHQFPPIPSTKEKEEAKGGGFIRERLGKAFALPKKEGPGFLESIIEEASKVSPEDEEFGRRLRKLFTTKK